MKNSAIMAVMGILTGFATASQAQSYLTVTPLKYSGSTAAPNKGSANTSTIKVQTDAPEKQFDLRLSMLTRGSRVQDDNIKASTSASTVGVEFTWNIASWIKSDLIAEYQFASGLAATVYGGEGSPYTGTGITEGSVSLLPLDGLKISAGIVETNFNPTISVYGGDALAGFRESYEFEAENGFRASLISHQAVPTQLGTSNRVIDDNNNDAALILHNANIGFEGERSKIRLSYSKYDFYNMTRAAAADSKFLGNEMIGEEGSPFSFFKFQFKGQEVALQLGTKFRKDDQWVIRGAFTKNDEAPDKKNTGWIANSFYEFNFGRYQIRPSFSRFRFESDVIPAFYSSGTLGYLNRDGYSAEIRGKLKPFNLETYVRYVNTNEIEDRLVQSDRVNYSVGLEVSYDVL